MNPAARQLLSPDATKNYARVIDPQGNGDFAAQLNSMSARDLFDSPVKSPSMAACCQSGLWLLHNFLHESHEISQSIDSAEGSWWHAIMHRSEGDFSNAKYWYRRVGEHEAMGEIEGGFDPNAFVDLCQRDYRSGPLSDETQAIAFAEWKALFDFCYQHSE